MATQQQPALPGRRLLKNVSPLHPQHHSSTVPATSSCHARHLCPRPGTRSTDSWGQTPFALRETSAFSLGRFAWRRRQTPSLVTTAGRPLSEPCKPPGAVLGTLPEQTHPSLLP